MAESQFAKAFAAAQAQLANPKFDKVNTAFGKPSGYASLPSVLDAVRPVLNKHGIALLQMVTNSADGKFSLTTRLMHVSGESVETTFSMALPSDPQKAVALSTYMRRMALSSMLGVAGEEDDDGNSVGSDSGSSATNQGKAPEPTDGELAQRMESIRQRHTLRALQGKDPSPKKDQVRVEGVVETVYLNDAPKPHKIVLEDGTVLKAWNDKGPIVEPLVRGERYVFTCSRSKPRGNYPPELMIDSVDAAIPGEEIPF